MQAGLEDLKGNSVNTNDGYVYCFTNVLTLIGYGYTTWSLW
jgi:hypothetical protein